MSVAVLCFIISSDEAMQDESEFWFWNDIISPKLHTVSHPLFHLLFERATLALGPRIAYGGQGISNQHSISSDSGWDNCDVLLCISAQS